MARLQALSFTSSVVERLGNELQEGHEQMTRQTGGNSNMPCKRQFPSWWQSGWDSAQLSPRTSAAPHRLLVLIGPGSMPPKCHTPPRSLIWPPCSRNVAPGKCEKGESCSFCKGRIPPSQWPFQEKHGLKKHIPLLLAAQSRKAFTHT